MELKMRKIKSYADTAIVWSKRSACVRKQAIGYNGTVSGLLHCNELFQAPNKVNKLLNNYISLSNCISFTLQGDEQWIEVSNDEWRTLHHTFSEQHEIHAEQNALLNMIHTGTKKVSNMGIICTLEPCLNCAKIIIGAGIKHVWYIEKYDRATYDIKQYFKRAGVTCEEFIW